ncbi:MAG TPA: hypothetical protein VL992_13195 [Tepidisphaeraceae bacterium]|nr:hypothetical protein [Tepidisphaeraceae bacterium]
MILELTRFLASTLILIFPGIFLCRANRMGSNWLETVIHGSCLGLALAVYLASLISHFDLRWFYAVWACVAILSLILNLRRKPRPAETKPVNRWLILVLLIVAASRYAIALPQELPDGWDPSFHCLLARKIQIAHHAISDWTPFESVALNYPTGSHTLVAVLSTITGLPVHTIFKDLIPFLGIWMTGQVFLLARRSGLAESAALFAALAYGLWSDFGSINYYGWGGLPNEIGMLFFLSMLTAWLESRTAVMSIQWAALILSHHHVMLTSAAIAAVTLAWPGKIDRRRIVVAGVSAAIIDTFFLVPYAAKISTLASTHVLHSGENRLDLFGYVLPSMGLAFLIVSAAGIVIAIRQRRSIPTHPIAMIAVLTLTALYFICEYLVPLFTGSTILTPSRFPTDMACFLALFAGCAAEIVQQKLRLPTAIVIVLTLLIALTLLPTWRSEWKGQGEMPDYLAACQWINQNTPPATYVISDASINSIDNQLSWIPYLTWRRGAYTPLPDSEPLEGIPHPRDRAQMLIAQGGPSSDPVVAIVGTTNLGDLPVLWSSESGIRVVRIRPRP